MTMKLRFATMLLATWTVLTDMTNPIELIAHPYVVTICRWFIAIALLIAGISKMIARDEFIESIIAFDLLSVRLARAVGRWLPVAEVLIGFMLLVGWWTQLFVVTALTLISIFTLVVGITRIRGKNVECNCFGRIARIGSGPFAVIRNLVIVVCLFIVLQWYDGYLSVDEWTGVFVSKRQLPVENMLVLLALLLVTSLVFGLIVAFWKLMHVNSELREENQ